ncbi:MAG: SsrA-binding protein SmpB [Victivallales bacterium]|nr:SsrA-binding protein SmpB [Victivallales bacterium]
MKKNDKKNNNSIIVNKKAFHDFQILERYEAGIELKGTEVKSCKERKISLADTYAKIKNEEIYIYNVHISPYEQGNRFNHDPRRVRKLLMHKKEILKLNQQIREKGNTIVPLKFYLKNGKIKVEIAVAKGKTHGDKRDTMRKKQDDLAMKRAIKNYK